MNNEKKYVVPRPIVNKKEEANLQKVNERYKKLTAPNMLTKVGKKANAMVPKKVKKVVSNAKKTITEAELFTQCMKVVSEGFEILEKEAAKLSVSEKTIIKQVSRTTKQNNITHIDEVCLARSYEISRLVNKYRTQDLVVALIEGGTTGAFGFGGLPFNIVFSTFIYYRAVQSVAMYYGYDIKNDPSELIIASDVFMNALSPRSKGSNEVSNVIAKIMVMTEATAIKQTTKKTWEEMATRGGVGLLLTQMRALANKSAKTALEKTGQKGLEESVFKGVFEQIGKKLTKEAIGKMVPVVGAVVGGLFDTAQMNIVLEYADVFYHKRFLLEKEVRINTLIGMNDDVVIDIEPLELVND